MTTAKQAAPEIRAAGGVVIRRRRGQPEFLLVHRPRYDDWSLPKGKLEPDEKYSVAARREVEEETGSRVTKLGKIGSIAYNSNGSRPKVVRYWLFEHTGGTFTPNSEVDEIRWVRAANALQMMTYPRDRNVLEWGATLIDSPRAGRVHMVRHAKAGSRSQWKDSDAERPLSGAGKRQSAIVADALSATPITHLLSSRYRRCLQTLEPLADALGSRIRVGPGLTEGDPTSDLVAAASEVEGRSVVMCSHGAEMSAFLEAVAARGALLDGPQGLPEKGGIWTLDLSAGTVTSGRYRPAPR